jgi:peptidoglycan/xylan/chitin deacetylase (PgdA/CDA1 family)
MPRVLVVAAGNPIRVLLLARQIERHVPEATICGIVYKHPAWPPLGMASLLKASFRGFGASVSRLVYGLIHGGRPQQLETNGSVRDVLSRKCHEAGWGLRFAKDIDTPQVLEGARQLDADLVVVVGLVSVPAALASLPPLGTIQGLLLAADGQGSELLLSEDAKVSEKSIAMRVKICHMAGGHRDLRLAEVEFVRQPLDTPVSLELKSNVILRDLLVQSVAALAKYPASEAAAQVGAWVHRMIPSCFTDPGLVTTPAPANQAPPLWTRSKLKLCVYSLMLLSPSVLLRNWLRRWRRQHPILVFNSHLISDRHHRMTVPTEAFLREVQFLQRHYRIVNFAEAVRLLKSGSVSEPTLVLTFDDGYQDNFLNLRAVSEETGVPVVMFVSTQLVTEHSEFPHDCRRGIKGFHALTWEQIRYWSVEGTEFHSHTCSHFDCGSMDEEALQKEIVRSKHVLENKLGKPVTAFAFPFGKLKNMSAPAIAIAEQTYDHFLSSAGGENFPSESELHKHILRKHLQGNAWEAELELQGVFEIATFLKRLVQCDLRRSDPTGLGILEGSGGGQTRAGS